MATNLPPGCTIYDIDGPTERPDIEDEPEASQPEIEESVIARIRQRREAGRRKYGMSMERTDLTRAQWLRHAQEEAMDLAIYLERLIVDEENVKHHA